MRIPRNELERARLLKKGLAKLRRASKLLDEIETRLECGIKDLMRHNVKFDVSPHGSIRVSPSEYRLFLSRPRND